MILKSNVITDEFTAKISKAFDFDFTGEIVTDIKDLEKIPSKFKLGLIVGPSGSGKSTLLKHFGEVNDNISWDNSKAICSHFKDPDDAIERLTAMGLNSIPSMLKPYSVLSNGEKYRALLSRILNNNAIIDEFTSVVDRNVAKSMSVSISKYIEKKGLTNIVIASCHDDIVEWLNPNWVYYTDSCTMVHRGLLRQPPTIQLDIVQLNPDARNRAWEIFKKHHYLSNEINSACKCYGGFFNNQLIAFSANLCLPGKIPPLYEGDTRQKFRGSRLVVLPDFQGMGIGTRFSNAVAQIFLDNNYRYFAKTAHIRMGEYRQTSNLWRATATNLKDRSKSQNKSKKEMWHHLTLDTKRICYSHEYIGPIGNIHRDKYDATLEK